MRRRFVIGADPLDKDQVKKLNEYLGRGDGAWWHWIGNLWFFNTKDADITAEKIRDQINDLNPQARVVVLEFPEDIDWATSATENLNGRHIASYFQGSWSKKD